MESNGKRVTTSGEPLDYFVGEVDFGEPGTTGQHSFFQLMHMGQVALALPLPPTLTPNSNPNPKPKPNPNPSPNTNPNPPHMGQVVPADFLGFIETPLPHMAHETVLMEGAAVSHHDELMANFFAQASLQPYVASLQPYLASLQPYVASLQPHVPAPAATHDSALW